MIRTAPQIIVDQATLDPAIDAPEHHPQLLLLHDYWLERCDGDRLPARRDIDPVELKNLLSKMLLVDVVDDPPRFRYRLFGTEIVQLYNREMTGLFVDDIQSDSMRTAASAAYTAVVTARRPLFSALAFVVDWRRVKYDRLLLPLATDGHAVTMVMGAIIRR